MRSHNNEHSDSLPVLDISAVRHVAYVFDALIYYMRSGTDSDTDVLRDANSVQSWQDHDENENEDQEDDTVTGNVTQDADSMDEQSDGGSKAGRKHPFFQRSDSTIFLGCPPDPFHMPLLEALPLADQPHLLQPNSRREDLFGMAKQTVQPPPPKTGPQHLSSVFDKLPLHLALSGPAVTTSNLGNVPTSVHDDSLHHHPVMNLTSSSGPTMLHAPMPVRMGDLTNAVEPSIIVSSGNAGAPASSSHASRLPSISAIEPITPTAEEMEDSTGIGDSSRVLQNPEMPISDSHLMQDAVSGPSAANPSVIVKPSSQALNLVIPSSSSAEVEPYPPLDLDVMERAEIQQPSVIVHSRSAQQIAPLMSTTEETSFSGDSMPVDLTTASSTSAASFETLMDTSEETSVDRVDSDSISGSADRSDNILSIEELAATQRVESSISDNVKVGSVQNAGPSSNGDTSVLDRVDKPSVSSSTGGHEAGSSHEFDSSEPNATHTAEREFPESSESVDLAGETKVSGHRGEGDGINKDGNNQPET